MRFNLLETRLAFGSESNDETQWGMLFIRSSRTEYRPLEGFVLAVTPFNFVSTPSFRQFSSITDALLDRYWR